MSELLLKASEARKVVRSAKVIKTWISSHQGVIDRRRQGEDARRLSTVMRQGLRKETEPIKLQPHSSDSFVTARVLWLSPPMCISDEPHYAA